jgi:RND family efflux transporter, MFP subunit
MTRTHALRGFAALAGVLLLSTGCQKSEAANAKVNAEATIPTRTVTVQTVGRGSVVTKIDIVGELQGIEEVRVFSQVPDRIRTLTVNEGDKVRKGDIIATIWGEAQAEAVNQAEAGLEAALASRDAAKDSVIRMRNLFENHSITASQLEASEAQYRAAEAQVRQATAGVASAGVAKNKTVVRSPTSGVVSQIILREGDLASGSPILTVIRPDRLKAVLRVPERYFLRMKRGMKVEISPLAKPDQVVEDKVGLLGPVVDRTSRTGLVEVYLNNKDGKLVAGSAIRAVIELDRRENVMLIPGAAAILSTETERTGRASVFVRDGDVAHERQIKIGVRQADELEVLEGLKDGESVVVRGSAFLREGNPIHVVEPTASNTTARN